MEYPKITLEAVRVNAHFSRKKAAESLGISTRTLANYEKGKTVPDLTMGKKMEGLYKFPLQFILLPYD